MDVTELVSVEETDVVTLVVNVLDTDDVGVDDAVVTRHKANEPSIKASMAPLRTTIRAAQSTSGCVRTNPLRVHETLPLSPTL